MWTHNFFLILSMFNGNGAELATDAAALPSLVMPSAQHAALSTMAPQEAPKLTKPARKTPVATARPAELAELPLAIAPVKAASQPLPAALPAPTLVFVAQPGASLLAPTFASGTQVALAPDASAVIGKVQDFYNTTKSFSAVFTQTVTNQTFNKLKPKVSKGKVYILKPGKMRWDYKNKSYKKAGDPKVSKSFISDGSHLWAVMHKNKQYYKEELDGSTLPVAVSFLMGTGDLRKEFDVAFDTAGKFGSKSDVLLVLTPKKPSARYKKLWLVVDSKNHSVKQSIVLNSKGDTNSIRFSAAVVNDAKLKKGHFIFNAKANKDFRLVTPPKAAK